MGLFDFLKRKAPDGPAHREPPRYPHVEQQMPRASAPQPPAQENQPADISPACMQFKEGKPYLALVGQTFDAWGIVDVFGDTRAHIAVKNIPAAVLAKTGATTAPEIVAIERKLVIAHTKGFHDLPRDEAFELLDDLRENLQSWADDMKERVEGLLEDRDMETAADAKWLRADLKEIEKEFLDYWRDDLKEFRDKTLPQALVEYWDGRRDEAESEAEYAKQAKQRAIDKMKK